MATYKVTLEYDGTAYSGWQRQARQPTIQEALESALERISQTPTPIIGAGRTDAGVHALGQVASFRSDRGLAPDEWKRALNGVLPEDITVLSIESVAEDFHARYSARAKRYAYRILNRPERAALERHRLWHLAKPLNLDAMRQAAGPLIGRHDFSSFQGSPTDNENPVCDVTGLEVELQGEVVQVEVEADRFLKQMVRAMVGTLVEVGLGKRAPGDMKDILAARDRRVAGYTAPPQGLYLVTVRY